VAFIGEFRLYQIRKPLIPKLSDLKTQESFPFQPPFETHGIDELTIIVCQEWTPANPLNC
jgi:hypothetical protein